MGNVQVRHRTGAQTWGLSQPSHAKGAALSPHSPKFPKVTKATVMPTGSEVVPAGHQSKGQLKEISITFQAFSVARIAQTAKGLYYLMPTPKVSPGWT